MQGQDANYGGAAGCPTPARTSELVGMSGVYLLPHIDLHTGCTQA